MRLLRRIVICVALLAGGPFVFDAGWDKRTVWPGVVWVGVVVLGVVLIGLGLLLPVGWLIVLYARFKKDRALQEPGTVQLLTAVTSPIKRGSDQDEWWELTSDMQIRLDSGTRSAGRIR
jgi:hypothetical protein